MVRIVNFYQAGVQQVVSVNNAAIVFVMITAQQFVDLVDKRFDLGRLSRDIGWHFPNRVQVPSSSWVNSGPELGELLPCKQAVQHAAKDAVEVRCRRGF